MSPRVVHDRGDSSGDRITTNPKDFAETLRQIDNENEVLVMMKNADAPRVAADFIRSLPLNGPLNIALPNASGTEQRQSMNRADASESARNGLMQALSAQGVEPYRNEPWSNALAVRIPDDRVVPVLAMLLNHPSVDYVEANERREISFTDAEPKAGWVSQANALATTASPTGTNPYDTKHTFHDVLGAWDYTRGAGARVGILDSGYAYDQDTDRYHADGDLLTSSKGIQKIGFVNDYVNLNNCASNGGQPYGDCLAWDDQGHGTSMAGLVGMNDNNVGYVGIMPEGLTISMKIAQNCRITTGCANDSYTFKIESDDFYHAVRWASFSGNVDVLSMSFGSSSIGSSVYGALYDAYHDHDILLLAGTGNIPSDPEGLVEIDFVMGVGGLNPNGGHYGKDNHEDVSGLSSGRTTGASCPSTYGFCEPNEGFYPNSSGTSASTAIVSGIAGLVRSYSPSISAPDLRQRLRQTADASNHYRVNARAAVLNDLPLSVAIDGPNSIASGGTHTWEAMPDHGNQGYSYQWEYQASGSSTWTTVGTSKTYSESFSSYIDQDYDFTLRATVTSGSETAIATRSVSVNISGNCNNPTGCPGVE